MKIKDVNDKVNLILVGLILNTLVLISVFCTLYNIHF